MIHRKFLISMALLTGVAVALAACAGMGGTSGGRSKPLPRWADTNQNGMLSARELARAQSYLRSKYVISGHHHGTKKKVASEMPAAGKEVQYANND